MDGHGVYVNDGSVHFSTYAGSPQELGPLFFVLRLTYDSRREADSLTGYNWFSLLDTAYFEHPSGDVDLLMEDGVWRTFEFDDPDYISPPGVHDTLEKVSGQFVRTSPEGFKVTYAAWTSTGTATATRWRSPGTGAGRPRVSDD